MDYLAQFNYGSEFQVTGFYHRIGAENESSVTGIHNRVFRKYFCSCSLRFLVCIMFLHCYLHSFVLSIMYYHGARDRSF